VLARAARRVCLAFPLAGRQGARYRVTGRPGPPAQEDRAGARERLGLISGRGCLLVFGGSLGARSINMAAVEASPTKRPRRSMCCTWPAAATIRSWPRERSRKDMTCREYLDLDEFGDALAAADLVVARAGGSVFEIAASGTPAILVPYPYASADHQTANARWMADAGAAIVIPMVS